MMKGVFKEREGKRAKALLHLLLLLLTWSITYTKGGEGKMKPSKTLYMYNQCQSNKIVDVVSLKCNDSTPSGSHFV